MAVRIVVGDAGARLGEVPDASVQCCVTSPPYFGLRDYGVEGQIGLEATPDEYVARLVGVFREVRRVLREDGTLWLNLGDSYAASGSGGNPPESKHQKQATNAGSRVKSRLAPSGLKPKDLIGIPWMVAFALRADGWYLRQDIVWHKPNPMPESVRDRCTRAHEYVFMLSRSARYWYDAGAIAEARADDRSTSGNLTRARGVRNVGGRDDGLTRPGGDLVLGDARNRRSVWTVAPAQYAGAHFATFPPALIEPCILAGCPVGGTVLDPFAGAGTTGLVADRLARHAVLIELNPAYAAMARARVAGDSPLFAAPRFGR